MYGSQNTLRFYSGGTEKMAIGANVDFATAPYVSGSQIDTNDVVEGTNLYYTDARFDTRLATKTTTNLTEGTNLYFTTARARQSISASSPLSYDNTSGVISLPSGLILKQWSRRVNNFINASITYYKLGLLSTNSGGDGSFNLRGTLGGWEANTQASFEFSISTRSSRLVWGSLNSSSFSVANLIGRMDFLLYETAAPQNIFELYMVLKNNTFQAFDFTVQYCDNGNYFAFNPTTTPDPAPSGGSNAISSILSVLTTYTVAGNVGFGTSAPTSRLHIVTPDPATDFALLDFRNTNNYGIYAQSDSIPSRGNTLRWMSRDFNLNVSSITTRDILTMRPEGNVGIGTASPSFRLDVQQPINTTARIRSLATTGDAQLLLQNDNVSAGGGLVMYGSLSLNDSNKRNGIELGNRIGGVFISSSGNMGINVDDASQTNFFSKLAISGNVNLGRGDNTFFDSGLVIASRDYRTSGSVAGIHFGVSYNGFGPCIGLISNSTTGNTRIEFGHRTDGGVADGRITFSNANDVMDIRSGIITFSTNAVAPLLTERARFLNDGTFVLGDSLNRGAFSTSINNVEQVLGRVAIKGYSSGDQNPVIMFQEWNGGLAGGREHYFFVDGANGFRTATSTGAVPRLGMNIAPAYQIQLSTDSAGKPTTNTWTIVSDERLKEDIEDANLDICYENMKRLKLKRFKYKDDWLFDETGNRKTEDNKMLGFIAQEVKQVFPKAITIIDDTEQSGIEDLHTLNTDQLIKSSYGALQKLIQKVENLEETIIKERIQYKAMKQKQDALITKQGVLIDSMKKALLMRGITI
jgi:hypothetical protein